MLKLTEILVGSKIEYIGDSFAFGGEYNIVTAESTYAIHSDCPDNEKGKFMIIELMNDDTPMFFSLDSLDPKEWKFIS